jgi:hypothetical protein
LVLLIDLLFTHESVDGFHSVADPLVVYVVMHILSILIGYQYAGILQDPKVLGSNGLLNLEGIVNLIHLDILVLIKKFEDLQAERVSQGSHKFCRHL